MYPLTLTEKISVKQRKHRVARAESTINKSGDRSASKQSSLSKTKSVCTSAWAPNRIMVHARAHTQIQCVFTICARIRHRNALYIAHIVG